METERTHHHSSANAIEEPVPLYTGLTCGEVQRSKPHHHDFHALQRPTTPRADLEKGIQQNTIAARQSSDRSIGTRRSSTSTQEALKAPAPVSLHCSVLWSRIRQFIDNDYTAYRKIFTLIFVVNTAILIALVAVFDGSPSPASAANAAAINLAAGVLFRQEQVVNALFQVLTSAPLSWPLWIRGNLAKVFHYGGMHSGCGVAAVAWFLLYTALATKAHVQTPDPAHREALASAWVLVALFALLLGGAYPAFRRRYHNLFEIFHRFAGWAALAVFWAHVLFAAHGTAKDIEIPMSAVLVSSVPFWCILVATVPIILSWAQLRRRAVQVEPLSEHATRLRFDHRDMEPCFGIRVSTNPLLEWHSFATIPGAIQDDATETSNHFSQPNIPCPSAISSSASAAGSSPPSSRRGFSLIVSNAGDWTSRTIHTPPQTLWVRGTPVRGVIYAARLFRRVVIVATGSGIGPCLSLLVAHSSLLAEPPRVLWSAPAPEATFGPRVLRAVQQADPNAVVWDTRKKGRPDLCQLAYDLVGEIGAEAVFVISNPRVCKAVTTGLQRKGVRAYAPIFDS